MEHVFELGSRVKLVSFHGEEAPSYSVSSNENFWVLVGGQGEVVSDSLKLHAAFPKKGKRALVKFDQNLIDLGLISHNEIPNSLWIFISDLEGI